MPWARTVPRRSRGGWLCDSVFRNRDVSGGVKAEFIRASVHRTRMGRSFKELTRAEIPGPGLPRRDRQSIRNLSSFSFPGPAPYANFFASLRGVKNDDVPSDPA